MNSPQRIIHIITGLGQGGAETMLEKLLHAGHQLEPSVEQEVISLGEIGTVGLRLKAAGFTVRALGLNRRLANPWVLARLWLWLRHSPRDTVVQTWMYHGDLIGGLLARAAGLRKVVWNVRQAGLDNRLVGRATYRVMQACARASSWLPRVIVANADAAIAAHSAFGYRAERFHLIPNGFDMQLFAPDATGGSALRAEWQVATDELLVGVVARNDPQKDLPGFVQMAAHLVQHVPNARFVMVGRGVPSAPDINAAIEALNLRARFTLCEQRTDIAAVHSAIDIFCLSSLNEGFPNVLGEAMACATPAISTACGDAPRIIGEPLHIAPTGQPEALARCVMRVAALEKSERIALGFAQRARITSQFSIDSVWWQYSRLWRGL